VSILQNLQVGSPSNRPVIYRWLLTGACPVRTATAVNCFFLRGVSLHHLCIPFHFKVSVNYSLLGYINGTFLYQLFPSVVFERRTRKPIHDVPLLSFISLKKYRVRFPSVFFISRCETSDLFPLFFSIHICLRIWV
jgi:hypothetical protein